MSAVDSALPPRPVTGPLAGRSFYFWMAAFITVLVVGSFSTTMPANLIKPAVPRPLMLYVHTAVFFAWLALFLTQSILIGNKNVRLHRTLGVYGAWLGASVAIVGVLTTLVMAEFNQTQLGRSPVREETFAIIPLNDMLCFTVAFALAIRWRKRPEYHRRLMLIAMCTLTAAAWARLPIHPLPALRFHLGVDLLILGGVVRDLVKDGRIHPVYVCGLPLLVITQVGVMSLYLTQNPVWRSIARRLIDLV